jgi:NAD-dependent DNA ligase
VIAGLDAGSKADKATQLNVPLLEESAIAELLSGVIPADVESRRAS